MRFVRSEEGYKYSYGPPGIKGILQNKPTLFYAAFASLGGLTFGYDQGVIATVLVMNDFIRTFPISAWQKGFMTAMLELGALLGSLIAGTLSEQISRTGGICVACVIFCLGSAFQCWATALSHLIIGRTIGGIGVGALSMLCPLYLAEISPPETRGSLMAIEQVSICLGVVIGYWLGFFTRSIEGALSWRIPLGVQLIPGILLGIGSLWLPPSPRLLYLRGQDDAGLGALKKLRVLEGEDVVEYDIAPKDLLEGLEIQIEVQLIREAEAELSSEPTPTRFQNTWRRELNKWSILLKEKYRSRVLIGVVVMIFQQWTGVNALIYYAPSLMQSIGLDPGSSASLIAAGFVSITQLVASLPVISIVDRVGRRSLLMSGAMLMAFSHGWIALLTWFYHDSWQQHNFAALSALGFIYLFTFSYGTSFGPIGWVLPGEVIPLEIRGRGVALSTASNWINNFLIGLITPRMLEASPSFTYLVFASACILAFWWSKDILPETSGISLEEMGKLFGEDTSIIRRTEIEEEFGLPELLDQLARRGLDGDATPYQEGEE